ncbi:MAG: ATP-binding protein [Bacteroidota bacterium]
MIPDPTSHPALQMALGYLAQVIQLRLQQYFGEVEAPISLRELPMPSPSGGNSSWETFLAEAQPSQEQYVMLVTALAPHIQPQFFDQIITQALPQAGDFPQLGGVRGKQHRGFLPTGETVLFLLAGEELKERFRIQQYFSATHWLGKKQLLWLESPPDGEPKMSGKLVMAQEHVELFTQGMVSPPRFSLEFPAQLVETEMEWEDLVLSPITMKQVQELETWVKHGQVLLHELGMKRRLKPGFRALFHGPPGTGKTLTAALLGKFTNKPVYKVDLSMVVSKFIGETEKNLSRLFARAENKDWILFFDEADALFGKRTSVRDAHDKYANQEVAYLLQRVESYHGLVILASNFKGNIDEAFLRRFQSIVHFPLPRPNERLQLWQMAFPPNLPPGPNVSLEPLAKKYEITGSAIMNVVQYCCLQALANQWKHIPQASIIEGIKREFAKEGKLM